MKYVLMLIIMLNNGDPILMVNKHPPFDTKDGCVEYGQFIEPKTQEMLAKMIDEGVEVIDHGTACKPVSIGDPA